MTRLGTLGIELWSNSVWQGGLAANNSDIDGGGIGEADILEQQRNSTNKNIEVTLWKEFLLECLLQPLGESCSIDLFIHHRQ